MPRIRVNVDLPEETVELLNRLSSEADTTKTEIVRRALALLNACYDKKREGYPYLGFSDDPKALKKELVGLF